MATYKISQLTTATAVSATNQFEINQNGTSKSVEVSVIDVYIKSISNLPVVVSVSSASNALRITQTGTGNALLVEDSANPDATPFVIDASGNVGIGTSSPDYLLTLQTTDAAISMKDSGGTTRAYIGVAGVFGSAPTGALRLRSDQGGLVYGFSGTEQLRIDTSGNLGIGTSSPSTYGKFVVAGGNGNTQFNVGTNGVLRIAGYNSSYSGAALESVNTAQSAYLPIAINGLYTVLATGGTERLRIDSSGNVGIGTSSPSQKLEVYAAANSLQIESVVRNDQAGTGVAAIGFNVSSSASAETTSTKAGIGLVRSNAYGVGSLCFYNNATASAGNFTTADERMRIDTSGNLSVGTTAAPGRFNVSWDPNAQQGIATRPISETYSGAAILFLNSTGGQAGNIFQATSSVAYNTSSDYRMKENVAPLNGGLATIAALKPISYDWIIDKSKGEGFIAHELAEHIPLAVTGEKDAINKDGSIKSQGVDYSKIVVHLVAAMQELKADFDAYKAAHP